MKSQYDGAGRLAKHFTTDGTQCSSARVGNCTLVTGVIAMTTISVSPPNSVILVMDVASGSVPETMGNGFVSATKSCVAVGCLSEHDGPTEIHLGQAHEVTPAEALVFDGEISTPNKSLSICSVTNEELLSTEVTGNKTHVTIFANDPIEPDRIFVLFDR